MTFVDIKKIDITMYNDKYIRRNTYEYKPSTNTDAKGPNDLYQNDKLTDTHAKNNSFGATIEERHRR